MRRGITEKSLRVWNPLPADITDAAVVERAGLDLMRTVPQSPLSKQWHYSFGPEREMLTFEPGGSHVLRESDAQACLAELKEQGIVAVELDADDAALAKARSEGLRAAVTFHADRGNKRIQAYRRIHNLSREDLADVKHDIWSYYYNQALADMLNERLKEATVGGRKKASKAA